MSRATTSSLPPGLARARRLSGVVPSLRRGVIVLLALGAGGCSLFLSLPEERQQLFAFAVAQLEEGRPALAAQAAWRYLSQGDEEDPRRDRALRLLARSAEALGMSYAASNWYLEIARSRRDAELIPEALSGLERITNSGPSDDDALIDGFVAVEELSGLAPDLKDFVSYHQGLRNLREGLRSWASSAFKQIRRESPYFYRARYVYLVQRVQALHQKGRPEGARAAALQREAGELSQRFESLLEEIEGGTLKAELAELCQTLRLTLARLAMYQGDEAKALSFFEQVRQVAPEKPELLLELAWGHHLSGHPRRALGLLLALDAPAYRSLIAPERFLLEAMALRTLCHFGPARAAANRLQARYAQALEDLYSGVLPERSEALRQAAARRARLRPVSEFIELLQREQRLGVERGALGAPLQAELTQIYERALQAARARREEALQREVIRLGEELLAAEEGVRLILHELGVALLRGRRPPAGRPPLPPRPEPAQEGRVLFAFTGEFWSDELDELIVLAEDRCIE